MKKILFLLLATVSMYGQTYPTNPTPFGKVALKTNVLSASTAKINTQEADGQINYIPATSLPVPTSVVNALDLKIENSSGAIEGFAITNNGDGTVNITTGTAYLRTTNNPYSPLIKYVIPAVTNLALIDNANNFVLVDYNGGSPALTVTISPGTINTTTNSIAYLISRVGTTLDYINLVGQNVDANGKLRRRFLNSESLRRASGAVLTASNRNILLTAGLFYSGLIETTTPAFNTVTGSTFTQAYLNGSTWVRTTGNTQINNTQYSLTGVLTTMPSNDYRVDYVYILADNPSKLYVLLGNTTYNNIGSARLAPVPSDLPSELQFLGTRVGRIIIQKDATTMEVSSEFATIYQAGSVQLHNDLAGLNAGDFQHLTVAEKANLELKSNKQNSLAVDGTGVKYPTVDAVNAKLPVSYSNIVYVNATTPTTATIFDTNNPPLTNNNALKLDVNNLYIGTDASTWVYITSPAGYITKVVPPTSNFNIMNTSTDAGNSKVANLVRNGSLTILNDITALTNIRSSANNLILHDTGGVIFRGVRAPSWADNLSSRFFQIGNASDNVVFTTQNGNNANRMMFASQATQFQANGNYTTSPAPLGIFEVTNGTLKFFNIFSTGFMSIGTTPTTSAGTYDFLTRNTSTGVIEKVTSANIAPTASPTLTGDPKAPTPTLGDNDTSLATTAFVQSTTNSNAVLLTGDQTATGRKTFTSDNTTAGGITINNSKNNGGFGENFGIYVNNTSSHGIYSSSANASLSAIYGHTENSAPALLLTSSGGLLGNMLTAGTTVINNQGVLIANKFTSNGTIELKAYSVATLPTGVQGAIAYVTDATSPTYLGTLTGGGTVKCPVFFDGTNWVAH